MAEGERAGMKGDAVILGPGKALMKREKALDNEETWAQRDSNLLSTATSEETGKIKKISNKIKQRARKIVGVRVGRLITRVKHTAMTQNQWENNLQSTEEETKRTRVTRGGRRKRRHVCSGQRINLHKAQLKQPKLREMRRKDSYEMMQKRF